MHSRDIYSSHIVHSCRKSIFVVHYEILWDLFLGIQKQTKRNQSCFQIFEKIIDYVQENLI